MQGAHAHLCQSVGQAAGLLTRPSHPLRATCAAGPLLDLKNSVVNWDDFVAGRGARGWDWGSPCRPVLWSFVTCNSDDRVVELCVPGHCCDSAGLMALVDLISSLIRVTCKMYT